VAFCLLGSDGVVGISRYRKDTVLSVWDFAITISLPFLSIIIAAGCAVAVRFYIDLFRGLKGTRPHTEERALIPTAA